jgi:predicted MFS family arabinose efflux permease
MGAALGYILGGWVGEVWGWREAFYVAGAPGLVFAAIALFMPEPERGAMDDGPPPVRLPLRQGLRRVFRSPTWRLNTAATALMTFTLGGLAFWMPLFLQRERGLGSGEANTIFGGITVVAGLLGTLVGGYLGDRAQAKGHGGYFRVSGWGLLLGAPFALVLPYLPSIELLFACAFVAEFLLFLNTGPLNAALVACVPPFLRAGAVAINVFFIHLLGDAFSPTLMGIVSDWRDLSLAIALTAIPVAAGGLLLLRGARVVDRMRDGLLTVDEGRVDGVATGGPS